MATLPPWPIRRQTVHIGGQDYSLDTVADAPALLDALIAQGSSHPDYQDEVIPYWADLWHSALGLAQAIVEQPECFAGQATIELGCGLGLPGLVAARLGATLTFSDYVEDALAFTKHNFELNLPAGSAAEFLRLDWRQPPQGCQYARLLAADVAYERRHFAPLYACIRQLLAPGGQCWLSEPGREIAFEF
ncbi:MAG: hypothetical protein HC821_00190 [Lewinella sp.]|nr:hypothetical protein [Lewinella sp.]